MDSNDSKTLARTYFESSAGPRLARLRTVLADDVTFHGVLGVATGADECVAGLRGMAENIMTDIDLQIMVAEGADVLTSFHLHTTSTEPLPTGLEPHRERSDRTDPRDVRPSAPVPARRRVVSGSWR